MNYTVEDFERLAADLDDASRFAQDNGYLGPAGTLRAAAHVIRHDLLPDVADGQ